MLQIKDLLGARNKNFSSDQSSLNMEQYKVGSARQVMFNDFRVAQSFTLENSFFAQYSR